MATRPLRSGVLTLREHDGWGGSFFDSRHLTNFYNFDAPHNFGLMVANIFTSSDRFDSKVLTSLTYAAGNYTPINGEIYKWTLIGDDERLFRVSDVVETSPRPGFNGETFRIVLDKPWMHEPDVIMPEDNRFMLQIVGHPQQIGEGKYMYEVRMQGSDPTHYLPSSELQLGRTFMKATTMVSDENNQEYGTGQWGSQIELQSQIGHYAEKFEVTDKVVRKEIYARKNGGGRTSKDGYNVMNGKAAPVNIITKNGKEIQLGAFMTYMEMDLNDRLETDREVMMQYGRMSTRADNTGRYIMRTGPGFRQLVLDGHTYYHNGSLTAIELEDFFNQIFLYRKSVGQRKVVVDTGELGAKFFDQLLSDEASAFLTVDTHYIRQAPGGERHQLEYGAEFISFTSKNGLQVTRVYNPMKDNPNYCRRMHPDNPIYTVDSARMDIYDFAGNTDSIAPDNSNMSMIMEAGVEEYYWVSDLIDPKTGVVNDGRKVSNTNKGVSCRRASSGSLCVWDTSRIGSIIYEPDLI